MDLKRFINELLAWFRSLVVCAVSKDPAQLLDLPADELTTLQETAAAHSPQSLFLLFNLLMESLEKAAWSSRPRFAVEMAFIRAVQAEEVVPVTELLGRLDSILAGVTLPQTTEPAALYDKKKTVVPERSVAKASEPPPAPPMPEEDIPHPAEQPPSLPPQKVAAGERDIRKDWPDFIKSVKKPWIASALEKAASVHLENGRLILTYHDSIECSTLKIKEQLAELTALASDFFQESLSVVFDEPKACGLPAESGGAEAVRKERQALVDDPLVVLAAEIFNGQVGDIRVGPQYKKPLAAAEETAEGSDEA
jgi:DNA polymerase-3 subunit gamma/tau